MSTHGAMSSLRFPGGATGLSANSMVADDYSFTLRIVGTKGDVLVHNFIKPHDDDRVTIRTPAGTTVEHLGTRTVVHLSAGGVRRPRPARRAAAAGHRRRGGEHGLRRRRVPGGGHEPALGAFVAHGLDAGARATASRSINRPRCARHPPTAGHARRARGASVRVRCDTPPLCRLCANSVLPGTLQPR